MKKFRAFLPYIEAAIVYGLLFFYVLDFLPINITRSLESVLNGANTMFVFTESDAIF